MRNNSSEMNMFKWIMGLLGCLLSCTSLIIIIFKTSQFPGHIILSFAALLGTIMLFIVFLLTAITKSETISVKSENAIYKSIFFEITQLLTSTIKREFPDVGFKIINVGYEQPVKARIKVIIYINDENLGVFDREGHYGGAKLWNLNPNAGISGHFSLPENVAHRVLHDNDKLNLVVQVTIIDLDGSEYEMLPIGWVYDKNENTWFINPSGN